MNALKIEQKQAGHLETIKETIELYQRSLADSLIQMANARHPISVVVAAQDLALIGAKLDAMKNLYLILGGA